MLRCVFYLCLALLSCTGQNVDFGAGYYPYSGSEIGTSYVYPGYYGTPDQYQPYSGYYYQGQSQSYPYEQANSICSMCSPNCQLYCSFFRMCCEQTTPSVAYPVSHKYGYHLVPRHPTGFTCPPESSQSCGNTVILRECSEDKDCVIPGKNIAKRLCCYDPCHQRKVCLDAEPKFELPEVTTVKSEE